MLFFPTNNALRPSKGGAELVDDARRCDIERAIENRVTVIQPRLTRNGARVPVGWWVAAFLATGGAVSRVGFALLAVERLTAAVQAYRVIRRCDVRHHREWFVPPERFAAIVLAFIVLGCASVRNTREGRIPGEREDCQAAATQVAGNKATGATFRTLGWCDETGPAALASVWRTLPADTVRLRAFFGASSNLRDGRIFAAAFAAASDTTRRLRERAAALLVLVGQVDSTAMVTVVASTRAEVWRAQLARESHPLAVVGTTPLPEDARARVSALVKKIGASRPSGAAGLRDPLGVAVQAARLDLERKP
jgi:hypothetical protein